MDIMHPEIQENEHAGFAFENPELQRMAAISEALRKAIANDTEGFSKLSSTEQLKGGLKGSDGFPLTEIGTLVASSPQEFKAELSKYQGVKFQIGESEIEPVMDAGRENRHYEPTEIFKATNVCYKLKESRSSKYFSYQDKTGSRGTKHKVNTYLLCPICDPFEEIKSGVPPRMKGLTRNGTQEFHSIYSPIHKFYDTLNSGYVNHMGPSHGVYANGIAMAPYVGYCGKDKFKLKIVCPYSCTGAQPCLAMFDFNFNTADGFKAYYRHAKCHNLDKEAIPSRTWNRFDPNSMLFIPLIPKEYHKTHYFSGGRSPLMSYDEPSCREQIDRTLSLIRPSSRGKPGDRTPRPRPPRVSKTQHTERIQRLRAQQQSMSDEDFVAALSYPQNWSAQGQGYIAEAPMADSLTNTQSVRVHFSKNPLSPEIVNGSYDGTVPPQNMNSYTYDDPKITVAQSTELNSLTGFDKTTVDPAFLQGQGQTFDCTAFLNLDGDIGQEDQVQAPVQTGGDKYAYTFNDGSEPGEGLDATNMTQDVGALIAQFDSHAKF